MKERKKEGMRVFASAGCVNSAPGGEETAPDAAAAAAAARRGEERKHRRVCSLFLAKVSV